MLLANGLTLDITLERLVDLLPLLGIAIIGIAILEVGLYILLKRILKSKYTLPYTLVAPAVVALMLFTIYPFFYNIRLAFSDLRLKTMSCYIPNNDVTNVPCSLSQAAPGAEVTIQVEGYDARVEPNETADVAFTLDEGDEVTVTGRSQKIAGYYQYGGNPLRLNPDGTLSNQVCGADPICVRRFNEYKATVLDVQDERDWWPVENSDGQTGWIPNVAYYATDNLTVYADPTGDADPLATVEEGARLRLITANPLPTTWYEIQLSDGQTGWVSAEAIDASQSFVLSEEAPLYAEMDAASEQVATLASGQETTLLQRVTITWYQVFATADQIGWIHIQEQSPATRQIFTAGGDGSLYAEISTESEELGTIQAGDELTLLQTDTTTEADVTWYQVQTSDGLEGWTTVPATDIANVDIFTLEADQTLYEDASTDSAEVSVIPAGTTVRVADQDTGSDITWRRVRTQDRTMGWTRGDGDIQTEYAATETVDVYAQIGAQGEVLTTLEEGDQVRVQGDGPQNFARYRVRLYDEEATVGWINEKPREVVTTERDPVLYSLNYGWHNFKRVFVKEDEEGNIDGWGRLLQTQNSTFPRLMRTTLAWTSLNVLFHLIGGMILALILNRPNLKLRGLYRAIIILPWAIPQVIIALAWKGEFNYQFGFVNNLLQQIGIEPINWLFTPGPAFAAVTFVNIWLGIPFYMVTLLGGLQSIAGEYYEAAEIDGANWFQRFRNITVPLIRPVAVPIVTLDVIWTFNNFNVIYLITKGEPNESTNILVTALYNAAFGENGQFQLGFAAAFSLVIFAVLFIFASFWVTSSGALKGVYEE